MLYSWYTHLWNKSKSTTTIVLRTRKASSKDHECTPYTSRTKDKTSLVKTIRNGTNGINSQKWVHIQHHQEGCQRRTSESWKEHNQIDSV